MIITHKIIERINSFGCFYKDDDIKISLYFYMDNGVILTVNLDDITNMINRLYRVCLKYGLNLDKSKCKY